MLLKYLLHKINKISQGKISVNWIFARQKSKTFTGTETTAGFWFMAVIQCNLFYLFNGIFFINLMQSLLLFSNATFLQFEPNCLLSIQCSLFHLFHVIFFINAMQSPVMCLLRINFEERGVHFTIFFR